MSELAYVFGYASLVAERELLEVDGIEHPSVRGRLHGYRRFWGAAMNNWEGGETVKHFLDRETGERPHIRVAYLDVEPSEGRNVNGVVIPVDAERLAALDAREINYSRVEVTAAFEPWTQAPDTNPPGSQAPISRPVFTYVGLDAARQRCRQGAAEGDAFISRDYFAGVRHAFERLGADALAEFDRTTGRPSFPERDLQVVLP